MSTKLNLLVYLFALPLLAQVDQGRIAGTVKDQSNAIFPGAAVTVKNERTGEERTATTNDLGTYLVAGLKPSSYTVRALAPGFSVTEMRNVMVGVGQEAKVDLMLKPEDINQSINVVAMEEAALDTSSARIGVNVTSNEVAHLPLNGRQISQLYLLAPGAVNNGSGTYDNIRFSGRSNQQNIVRFDGVEGTSIVDSSPGNLNGESSSSFRLQASMENVQEFRVESNNYPAEYGTGTGGQISVITKSGSNEIRGSLFEYLRNDVMDARNFFTKGATPPLRMNQFGGSLGGPIVKDKFFFFGSYEGLRQSVGVNLIESVPSAVARARAVPSIQPLLAAYPLGTTPTSNPDLDAAFLNKAATINENAGSVRLDYRFNDKYSVNARYFRDQGNSISPIGVTDNAVHISAVPQNAVVALQQILSPQMINETKVGLNAVKTRTSGKAPAIPGVDIGAISVQIGGQVALSGIAGQTASAGIATPGGLTRANSAFNGRGQPYTNYSLSFIDNLSWNRGNHALKFGFEARPLRIYTDRQGGTTYSFSNLSDFLANRPFSIQFLGDVSAPSPFNGGATGIRLGKQEYYIGYAQDEWKLRSNLTMSYGLRYEYYTPMREDRHLNILFDTVTGVLKPPSSPFYQSSKFNFGPRLAFSWAPERFRNNTVFRIGAGFYYGPGQTEDQLQPIESDRVSRTLPTGSAYPIDPAAIIAGYDINSPTLGFQPRAYDSGYRLPERILSYTASVQQKLPGSAVLTVAYVGSQGRNLFLRSITNKIVNVATNPTTGVAIVTREFGGHFAEIDYKTSGGTDHYDSLQSTLNRRFGRGLTLGAQWTWSHSIGNTNGSNEARTSQSPYDFRAERGNNNFDVRHAFNLTSLYELPFGKGRRFLGNAGAVTNLLFGGWDMGGVINARSGIPIEVLVSRPDVVYRDNRTGAIVGAPILVSGVPVTTALINTPGGGASRGIRRPDLLAGVSPYLEGSDKTRFLNPAAFALPQPGTYGNLARNALRGPSLLQFDLTLQKRFTITERIHLEYRAEIYNLLNHANFASPPATLVPTLGTGANQIQPGQPFTAATAGGAFGVISSTVTRDVGIGTNRQIQMSLRLNF